MLDAVLDKFIDAAAHIVHGTEDVAIEGELCTIDVALVTFAAGFERRQGEL